MLKLTHTYQHRIWAHTQNFNFIFRVRFSTVPRTYLPFTCHGSCGRGRAQLHLLSGSDRMFNRYTCHLCTAVDILLEALCHAKRYLAWQVCITHGFIKSIRYYLVTSSQPYIITIILFYGQQFLNDSTYFKL